MIGEAGEIDGSLGRAAAASRGHFRYESGHHGDLWLDLDLMLGDARRARGWASELAARAAACGPEVVAGPLTGGALVAQLVAAELGVEFAFLERARDAAGAVRYQVPRTRRAALRRRRLLLIDDVVNAGSALLASLADTLDCGGRPVGLGCLLSLGDAASVIASRTGLPFTALESLEREMWLPADCPLCRSGVPLVDRVP